MKKLPLSIISSSFIAMALALSACAAAPDASSPEIIAKVAPLVLDLKAGEVLQFAMFKQAEGEAAEGERKTYFETAIPYARGVGNIALGNLSVQQTIIGENKPDGIALYKFPNETAMGQYQASPDWVEYKRMRREGWLELDIYSITLPSDTQLSFDPSKNYTIAAGWTKLGTETDYETYLDGIEADFDTIGARFLVRFRDVDLQSLNTGTANPSHLTLVEWSGEPNLEGLQASEGYKANEKYFQSAISRFNFYWVKSQGAT